MLIKAHNIQEFNLIEGIINKLFCIPEDLKSDSVVGELNDIADIVILNLEQLSPVHDKYEFSINSAEFTLRYVETTEDHLIFSGYTKYNEHNQSVHIVIPLKPFVNLRFN